MSNAKATTTAEKKQNRGKNMLNKLSPIERELRKVRTQRESIRPEDDLMWREYWEKSLSLRQQRELLDAKILFLSNKKLQDYARRILKKENTLLKLKKNGKG